jgi:hypothetical protein
MPEAARITLDDLADELLWVAWRNEPRADDPDDAREGSVVAGKALQSEG